MVKKILNGGGSLSDKLINNATRIFCNAKLFTAYEGCSSLTFMTLKGPTKQTTPDLKSSLVNQQEGVCVGKPAPHVELKISTEDSYHVGQILTRGPHLMIGYWDHIPVKENPGEEDWHETGDIGRIDDNGNLWLIGRMKGRIKSGGENIYPEEVGIISPSKLRMKLMGGQRKKDGGGGSKRNSARTSPSKLDDVDFVNNSLLASNSAVSDEEVSSMAISSVTFDYTQDNQGLVHPKDHTKDSRAKPYQFQKTDSSNSSSVHPLRSLEDENLDYDSNASSSSFEFHKGERSTHSAISRSLLRPMSSKWNDAEKWIINKQIIQHHNLKNTMQKRANRGSVKRVDFCQPALQMGTEKFSFTPPEPQHGPVSGQTNISIESTNPCSESKDLQEIDTSESSCPEERSVSMRDMGTEMTPIPSQEPSMTSTPVGATTPLRSPVSSIPSTPRRGAPTSTPIEDDLRNTKELTAQEVKLRTRKEILQLGVQLGKMKIAAWASKEDMEKNVSSVEDDRLVEEAFRIEFEKRAAAWEEAEKSKHNARFIRKEIKIQAWESQQKAKLEAEMRRTEAEVEQRRANAEAKVLKKIELARHKSQAKREAAESQKNRQAARAAAQAEYIRQTGRIPPCCPKSCCGWS